MDYLFNPRNLNVLESFCFAKTLFIFDFEGALGGLAMASSTKDLLQRLIREAQVGVMTSGKVSDLKNSLPFEVNFLIGNTGSEGSHTPAELIRMEEQTRKWLSSITEIFPVFERLGIRLVDRTYSLTFRYEDAPNAAVAEAYLQLALSHFRDARITHGKRVLNLLPLGATTKGMAIQKIMKDNQFKFGVFLGDDREEEEVFQFQNGRLLTIKVGKSSSLGKLYIHGPHEVDTVLSTILSFF